MRGVPGLRFCRRLRGGCEKPFAERLREVGLPFEKRQDESQKPREGVLVRLGGRLIANTKKESRDTLVGVLGKPSRHQRLCGELGGLPRTADIEDVFATGDYLRLYNWAFDASLGEVDLPATDEPILKRLSGVVGAFDHALPAHALTERRAEFFAGLDPITLTRFELLFEALNAPLQATQRLA